jgi:hypothetical protein
MPFELGLAYATKTLAVSAKYHFVLLEKHQYRLSRTLSDVDGHNPFIHQGKPSGIVTCMIEAFGRKAAPSPSEIYAVYRRLLPVADQLRHDYHRPTVYSRPIFQALVASATFIAAATGILKPNPGVSPGR